MQTMLETFLAGGVLAFMLTFTRVGTALMLMPGLGDTFIPQRVRLLLALGISFVLFPMLYKYMPAQTPATFQLIMLVISEAIIGLMIGTVARIFMVALDTAGMVISMQSGLANAQVFNPSLASQGSIIGAFLTVTGMVVLFSLNLHHMLIMGVVESYQMFPFGLMTDTGSMAELISQSVNASFKIGVKLAMPFMVMTLLIYVGMGVLSRLMPQIQVFMIVLPLQIWLSVLLIGITLMALFSNWAQDFENAIFFFFSNGSSLN
ncbi:MAG: flagellar biosynthetic protein FliR [Alphaproteobacteria bacterium]